LIDIVANSDRGKSFTERLSSGLAADEALLVVKEDADAFRDKVEATHRVKEAIKALPGGAAGAAGLIVESPVKNVGFDKVAFFKCQFGNWSTVQREAENLEIVFRYDIDAGIASVARTEELGLYKLLKLPDGESSEGTIGTH
jgi:hypothetical protein